MRRQERRRRAISARAMETAVATFSDAVVPVMGIEASASHASMAFLDSPVDSVPASSSTRPERSTSSRTSPSGWETDCATGHGVDHLGNRRRGSERNGEQRAGAGADALRVVGIGGVAGDDGAGGSEGVGAAEDGAQVAGALHGLGDYDGALAPVGRRDVDLPRLGDSYDLRPLLALAELREQVVCHPDDLRHRGCGEEVLSPPRRRRVTDEQAGDGPPARHRQIDRPDAMHEEPPLTMPLRAVGKEREQQLVLVVRAAQRSRGPSPRRPHDRRSSSSARKATGAKTGSSRRSSRRSRR